MNTFIHFVMYKINDFINNRTLYSTDFFFLLFYCNRFYFYYIPKFTIIQFLCYKILTIQSNAINITKFFHPHKSIYNPVSVFHFLKDHISFRKKNRISTKVEPFFLSRMFIILFVSTKYLK